ncbi:AMP-binding protein [Mumia zhuanghuii]|uniref:AMP-binding protein n=2 Tax=Mumia TaxID=1546255 RepID=A0ABW1QJI9_9ACTN|nr:MULTISPECIES: AMP-binding protein [Mumia]KAA1423035.1 AMP-binding protein [Mumia zhuanghuii]
MAAEVHENIATVWETIAEVLPDALAQAHGDRRFTWSAFERRANGVARTLLDPRASKDDRVALFLRNSPEYLEVQHAAFKIGIPAINTNYRYRDEELRYLFDDADVTSVVFHGSFTETMSSLRPELSNVRQYLHVDDGTEACPDWAVPYEQAAAADAGQVRSAWGRSGDDLFLLYTGGTTGMPKGVMWRVIDMLRQINDVAGLSFDLENLEASIRGTLVEPGPVHISCSPMMHGSGWFGATMAMHKGGAVASLVAPSLDPAELLDTIDRHRVQSLTIAGEVFARRILAARAEDPDRWDVSSVRNLLSSGGMLSEASKEGLLELWPEASILDGFSSSEGFGMGWSVATKGNIPPTGRFSPGANTTVLDEEGKPVEPGSDVVGTLVVVGRLPLGYYKDPEKSERTFPVVEGERRSVPGDRAVVLEDGTIQLMGRDSLCITSGGEKIFTEEVEGVILDHPSVADVLVIGLPDPEWGQTVAAVVSLDPEAPAIGADEVVAHVKERLASYKAPRHVAIVETVPRGPNGKAVYSEARRIAEELRQPASA